MGQKFGERPKFKFGERTQSWNEILGLSENALPNEILGIAADADVETAKKAVISLVEEYGGKNEEVVVKAREAYDYFVKKEAAYKALGVKPDASPHEILAVAADASQDQAKDAYATLVKLHGAKNPKLQTFIVAILKDACQNFSPKIETAEIPKTGETNAEEKPQTWYEALGVAENAAPHEILGIAADASEKEARDAYVALLRKHKAGSHQKVDPNADPNAGLHNTLAHILATKLTAAYEHFKNPIRGGGENSTI